MYERELAISSGASDPLIGDLVVPDDAIGAVVFAHGSGSSRRSLRNRRVAERLQGRRLATLLLDLLTPAEVAIDERTRALRFDIGLLGARVGEAIDVVVVASETSGLPIGLFGASTGAAAALVAAARRPEPVGAVVSRGGRPDLAEAALRAVQAPTLFVVGGRDDVVLDLNRQAAAELRSPHQLAVVPGATHLFEEPGALADVAELAASWFTTHLAAFASRGRARDERHTSAVSLPHGQPRRYRTGQ